MNKPNPLKSIRLTDGGFASRLARKYGWFVGQSGSREGLIHRDQASHRQALAAPQHVNVSIRHVYPVTPLRVQLTYIYTQMNRILQHHLAKQSVQLPHQIPVVKLPHARTRTQLLESLVTNEISVRSPIRSKVINPMLYQEGRTSGSTALYPFGVRMNQPLINTQSQMNSLLSRTFMYYSQQRRSTEQNTVIHNSHRQSVAGSRDRIILQPIITRDVRHTGASMSHSMRMFMSTMQSINHELKSIRRDEGFSDQHRQSLKQSSRLNALTDRPVILNRKLSDRSLSILNAQSILRKEKLESHYIQTMMESVLFLSHRKQENGDRSEAGRTRMESMSTVNRVVSPISHQEPQHLVANNNVSMRSLLTRAIVSEAFLSEKRTNALVERTIRKKISRESLIQLSQMGVPVLQRNVRLQHRLSESQQAVNVVQRRTSKSQQLANVVQRRTTESHQLENVLHRRTSESQQVVNVLRRRTTESHQLENVLHRRTNESQQVVNVLRRRMNESHHLANVLKRRTTESHHLANVVQRRTSESQQVVNVLRRRMTESHHLADVVQRRTAESHQLENVLHRRTNESQQVVNVLRRRMNESQQLANVLQRRTTESHHLANVVQRRTTESDHLANVVQRRTNETHQLANVVQRRTTESQQVVNVVRRRTTETRQLANELHRRTNETRQVVNVVHRRTNQQSIIQAMTEAPLLRRVSIVDSHTINRRQPLVNLNRYQLTQPRQQSLAPLISLDSSIVTKERKQLKAVSLDVAVKHSQKASSSQETIIKSLESAIKTVEQDLNQAKVHWSKPNLDMNRLADQMYKEFSRRIRLEQQRRGM